MSVDVLTFGCRLNGYESQVLRDHARAAGLTGTVVVNTCAVTAQATKDARSAIRRLARERPGARIVVTGCAAQVEPEAFAGIAGVSHVIGNAEKMDPQAWTGIARGEGEAIAVSDIMEVYGEHRLREEPVPTVSGDALRETAHHLVEGIEGQTRGYVQVQNGCDHRCTFCIIPFGRGNSRSVPMGAVVEQVARLTENRVREVVVTGVDITAYGRDLPGTPSLGLLVKAILRHVPDLPRLRLSSIDSVEADAALVDAMAGEPRLMPHLHLSLQAGDDLILKRMKRRHSRDDAIRFCDAMRRLRPDIVFGADIIAGFPTETEAMFARSLDLVAECGLTHLHVFPFSPRPGTPAARMPQVERPVIRERAARLRDAGAQALAARLSAEVGAVRQVLVEAGGVGRTEGFLPVAIGERAARGTLVPMRITGVEEDRLTGEPTMPQAA